MNGHDRGYYDVLGVSRDASQKDIRSAFRRMARKYHPDVNPNNPEATERFKEINEANEVLSDPEKRRKYDQYGSQWQQYDAWEKAGRPGGRPPGGPEPHVQYRTANVDDLNDLFGSSEPYSDFFQDLFGRTGRSGRRRTAQPVARRGEDVEVDTTITLEDAFRGTTRAVEIEGPNGTRRVEVRIPPGVQEGARVRAAGQGGEGESGGESGDLFLRVHILPHPVFTREGDDLRERVPVPLHIALLGGEVSVPTLSGSSVFLTVPPNTQNGARLRLRGLGMPRLRGQGSGDLYAEVDVRLPVPLTEEQRRAAERLRPLRETANV